MASGNELIRLAVFGLPVRHSLSPRIHGLFAVQAGLEVDYAAIETPEARVQHRVRDVPRLRGDMAAPRAAAPAAVRPLCTPIDGHRKQNPDVAVTPRRSKTMGGNTERLQMCNCNTKPALKTHKIADCRTGA